MLTRLLIAACILTALAAHAAPTPFPLGVYWPWERACGNAERLKMDKWAYVDQRLADMQAHHVDAAWVVNLNIADLGPLAERMTARKMKLVPALGELHYNIDWRFNNWEYLEKESRAALQAAGNSPAVLAWALCDEPTAKIFGEMEQFRQKFVAWGAQQPPITVTMWPDTPTYARETQFPIVCTDIYPFFSDGNPNGPNPAAVSKAWYRRQVQSTVQAARDNGRIPWIMPQSFCDVWGPWKYDARGNMVILPGGVMHWRPPTVGETRWQIWSAVGCGAQGFFWYCYEPQVKDNSDQPAFKGDTFPASMIEKQERPLNATGGLVHPDGTATPEYEAAAATYAAVDKLRPLLTGCQPMDIWPVQVTPPGWVGLLRNEALKRTFVAVVNENCDKAQDLTLSGEYKGMRDLRSGKPLPKAGEGKWKLHLEAGEGTLVEPSN